MKILNPAPRFLAYAVSQAIKYPRTPISYLYCPDCEVRFHPGEQECPRCHNKVGNSPKSKQESPLPWWGSVIVIVIGITCWVSAACLKIPGLDEAGRVLVYIPLGNLFGMSLLR